MTLRDYALSKNRLAAVPEGQHRVAHVRTRARSFRSLAFGSKSRRAARHCNLKSSSHITSIRHSRLGWFESRDDGSNPARQLCTYGLFPAPRSTCSTFLRFQPLWEATRVRHMGSNSDLRKNMNSHRSENSARRALTWMQHHRSSREIPVYVRTRLIANLGRDDRPGRASRRSPLQQIVLWGWGG